MGKGKLFSNDPIINRRIMIMETNTKAGNILTLGSLSLEGRGVGEGERSLG